MATQKCKKSSTGNHLWGSSVPISKGMGERSCKACGATQTTKEGVKYWRQYNLADPYGMYNNGCGKSH